MPAITLEALMAAQDIREERVATPEWGPDTYVVIRGLTKAKQHELRRLCTVMKAPTGPGQKAEEVFDAEKFDVAIVVAGVVEPSLSEEHVPMLRDKAAGVIDRIGMAILRISGLAPEAVKDAEKSTGS